MHRLLAVFFVSATAQAKDLGSFGKTFPIGEESLLTVIENRLQMLSQDGGLEKHQKIVQDRVKKTVMNPEALPGLKRATEAKSFTYDPSITVPYDLKNPEGIVFQKKGTRINPLETRPLTKSLLIFDGEDLHQLEWALSQRAKDPRTKLILVKGSPFTLTQEKQTPFYFDQGGVLVKKLGITHVPARVSQQDLRLLVEIISLDDKEKDYGTEESSGAEVAPSTDLMD